MRNPVTWLWAKFHSYFSLRQFLEPGGYKEIWKIAWPLIILSTSNTLMMITNRIFLAWNSPEEVAASMPAGQMFFTLMAFFLITTSFTATIVAQYHGANARIGCIQASWNGFYFGAVMAVLLTILLPLGGYWIIMNNGHSPDIAELEVKYFIAMTPCAGFTCMETAFLSFFSGRGKTFLVAAIKIAGCLLCVPLNYLLIFGKLGLPPMGILGAGIANSLANLFTMLAALCCFLVQNQAEYPTRQHRALHWKFIKKLLCFGTPAGLQTFIRNAAFAIVIMLIGRLGKEELAATSIAVSINMLGNMPMIGLMDATSIITGQYVGKGRFKVADRIAWRSLRMLFCWVLSAALLYLFCPQILVKLFEPRDGAGSMNFVLVDHYIRTILYYAVFFNFFDATRFIIMGSLRGAGDTKVPLFIGVATSWLIQLPGTLILVKYLNGTLSQVWFLLSFYIFADAIFMMWRRGTGAWKRIRVIEDAPPEPDLDPAEEAGSQTA